MISIPKSTAFKANHLLKNLTLEELDTVFNVGNREHGKYYLDKLPWYLEKKILRRDVEPVAPLYQFDEYQQRSQSMSEPTSEIVK